MPLPPDEELYYLDDEDEEELYYVDDAPAAVPTPALTPTPEFDAYKETDWRAVGENALGYAGDIAKMGLMGYAATLVPAVAPLSFLNKVPYAGPALRTVGTLAEEALGASAMGELVEGAIEPTVSSASDVARDVIPSPSWGALMNPGDPTFANYTLPLAAKLTFPMLTRTLDAVTNKDMQLARAFADKGTSHWSTTEGRVPIDVSINHPDVRAAVTAENVFAAEKPFTQASQNLDLLAGGRGAQVQGMAGRMEGDIPITDVLPSNNLPPSEGYEAAAMARARAGVVNPETKALKAKAFELSGADGQEVLSDYEKLLKITTETGPIPTNRRIGEPHPALELAIKEGTFKPKDALAYERVKSIDREFTTRDMLGGKAGVRPLSSEERQAWRQAKSEVQIYEANLDTFARESLINKESVIKNSKITPEQLWNLRVDYDSMGRYGTSPTSDAKASFYRDLSGEGRKRLSQIAKDMGPEFEREWIKTLDSYRSSAAASDAVTERAQLMRGDIPGDPGNMGGATAVVSPRGAPRVLARQGLMGLSPEQRLYLGAGKGWMYNTANVANQALKGFHSGAGAGVRQEAAGFIQPSPEDKLSFPTAAQVLLKSSRPDPDVAFKVRRSPLSMTPENLQGLASMVPDPFARQVIDGAAMQALSSQDEDEKGRFLVALAKAWPTLPIERPAITGLSSEFTRSDGTTKLYDPIDVQKWEHQIENSTLSSDEKAQRIRFLRMDARVFPMDTKLNDEAVTSSYGQSRPRPRYENSTLGKRRIQ